MKASPEMKNTLCIIAMVSCLMIGPVHSHGLTVMDSHEYIELADAWQIFLQAVSTGDPKIIRNLSAERIRCLSCLENTEEEEKEMEIYKATVPDWYKRLYEEKIYIPVDKFCREDYPIIFTKQFIRKLRAVKPTYATEDYNDRKIYEVVVSTSKPGEMSPGQEGCLHLFQFIKTNSGYRFWGIDTIP